MALDSTWWASGYEGVRWEHDFASAYATNNILTGWNRLDIYQADALVGLTVFSGGIADKNHGHFYAVKDSDSTVILSIQNAGFSCGQVLDPDISTYLAKKAPSGSAVTYKAPWTRTPYWPSVSVAGCYTPSGGSATYSLHHYQPHCWLGNPAEVIGSILRHFGLATSYIDTAAFSDADTALAALTTEPMVYFRRDLGEQVSDSLKRIARHCNDILCVTMAGKIALVSRSDPPTGPTSLTPQGATKITWRYSARYIVNYCAATHGQWVYAQYPAATPDDGTCSSAWEPNAESDWLGKLTDVYEDSTSQTRYGKIILENSQRRSIESGALVQRPQYHFPYFYDVDCKDEVMSVLASDECYLRREIEVEQDLRGLDYDVGYEVTNIAVTSDGDTIDSATCVRKRVDFNTMRVTSWLLERIT